jgi:AcrR family transcriptional regulator
MSIIELMKNKGDRKFLRSALPRSVERPRRGTPTATRARLVQAAARLFNSVGYHGTDSNRIAAEAGYSPGTFYKHFDAKRDIFLAVYREWVSAEWAAVELELSEQGTAKRIARRLVLLTIHFHTRWRTFRNSLLLLVNEDADVRGFYFSQRSRQLDMMAQLRTRLRIPGRPREEDAIHLFTMERCCDAIARGELGRLGVRRQKMIQALTQKVIALLS